MTLKKLSALFIAAAMLPFSAIAEDHPIRLVIHGGAGTILKQNMTPEKEAEYKAKLEQSLKAGSLYTTKK